MLWKLNDMVVSKEVILNTSVVIKDARKNHFATLKKRRQGTLFWELNKITFLWECCETGGVMRLEGHYDIHKGNTNNKYYNTNGGQCVVCPSPTMQHIVIHVVLMTVLLLLKKFYRRHGSVGSPPSILQERTCMFAL